MSRVTRGTRGTLAALVILLAACAPDDVSAPEGATTSLRDAIIAQGFDPSTARIVGDRVIVEGDIALSLRDLQGALPDTTRGPRIRTQWTTAQQVSQSNVSLVTIDLSALAGFSSLVLSGARDALNDWNGISQSSIYLVEGTPGDITVTVDPYYDQFGQPDPNIFGTGLFPRYSTTPGKPGPTISVNRYFGYQSNVASNARYNMAHEIGHTLGFRHANWQSTCRGRESDNDAILVPGTSTDDASSVMRACTAARLWSAWSAGDLLTAKTIYPGPANLAVTMSGTSVMANGTFTWTANVTGGTSPYTYKWEWHDFCDAEWDPVGGTGATHTETLVSNRNGFYLRVTVSTPFKGQVRSAQKLVGRPYEC